MRQELTLALIVASTPGRETEGDRLLQRRSDIAWRAMRHELQLAMDRQPRVLARADTISGTVEAADAATRQRQTATVIRQEHYKQWDADEKALEAALRRSGAPASRPPCMPCRRGPSSPSTGSRRPPEP